MSGTSYDSTCPRCGGEHLLCSSDYKPYDCVSGECLDCGFSYYTTETMMSLEHVNEVRAVFDSDDLPPLEKLAEPTPEGLSIGGEHLLRAVIIVEGGLVQQVLADADLDYIIIDYDDEGAAEDEITELKNMTGETFKAIVSEREADVCEDVAHYFNQLATKGG